MVGEVSDSRRVDRELIDLALGLVGSDLPIPAPPHVEVATADSIRAFARGTGDDNPLFCDELYASKSQLRSLVAPPLFPLASGIGAVTNPDPAAAKLARRLRGTPTSVESEQWSFARHIGLGTRLTRRDILVRAAEDNEGALLLAIASEYRANGNHYAQRERALRYGTIQPRRDVDQREKYRYSIAELDAIDDAYAAEGRRGASALDPSGLTVGQELDPMVKGPMTLTDLISLRAGVGPGPFSVEPLRLGYLNRVRLPEFYDRDFSGGYDARERLHWDEGYAQAAGHPSAYDYTHTRLIWASHLITNWIGDSGKILSIDFRLAAHNYVGDTHWMNARVDGVDIVDKNAHIELNLWGRNQLGTVTCSGMATVAVPSASKQAGKSGP